MLLCFSLSPVTIVHISPHKHKTDAHPRARYEVLFKRDKEMTDFIDKFPEEKEKELASQATSQKMVVDLLNHISQDLARQHNLPSEAKVNAMREDLSFKKRQVGCVLCMFPPSASAP